MTAMLTVLTLLGALTVPVCLATMELDSSAVSLYIESNFLLLTNFSSKTALYASFFLCAY